MTNLLRDRVNIDDKFAIDDSVPERYRRIFMVRKEESVDFAVSIVAVNLTNRLSITHRSLRNLEITM